MRKREDLEEAINGSKIFSIDRIIDGELFVTEERRFFADLAELMSIVRKDFGKIGYEIFYTAKDCIKAYKPNFGYFLNYFNAALKKSLFTQKAKEIMSEKHGGLTLDRKTDRVIRRIVKYKTVCGTNINDNKSINKAAEALNISPEKVVEAVAINRDIMVKSGNTLITNKDGDADELFDFIASKTATPDEAATNEEAVKMLVLSIDTAFQEQQERTKPLLSKLLTARLLKALDDISFIEKVIAGIGFVDHELFGGYQKNGTVPTAKEIAESLGIMEASASRTFKTFIEKVIINR
jgi:DNA-binding Lrp family transcriptional regulator